MSHLKSPRGRVKCCANKKVTPRKKKQTPKKSRGQNKQSKQAQKKEEAHGPQLVPEPKTTQELKAKTQTYLHLTSTKTTPRALS